MAETTKVETKNDRQRAAVETPPLTTMAIVAPLVAWLIPGAGHLIQKRYVRGFLLMFAVVTMFLLGLAMQGRVYRPNGGDILDILGFVGDVGAGGLYLLTRFFDWGQGAIRRQPPTTEPSI